MSEMLLKATNYQTEKLSENKMTLKQMFHFCCPVGWINDPNGFSVFKGENHLFFQYNPYWCGWGPMHWGHAKSADLLKWEILPVALAPDEKYDNFGCFSGSAISHNGKHIIVYTGVEEVVAENGDKINFQRQCVAVGDGQTYEKIAENPVITSEQLPENGKPYDFRDPKVWFDGDDFFLVAGNLTHDYDGQILLYRSKDLKNWEFLKVLAKSDRRYGDMWECPDFFSIGDKNVLIVSPMGIKPVDGEFFAGNGTVYIVGDYDKTNFDFVEKKISALDLGFDFYAPQSMLSADGRRIMIGWMQNWGNPLFGGEDGFNGMMSIPRELSLGEDNQLLQKPIRELENYFDGETKLINAKLEADYKSYSSLSGRTQLIEICLKSDDDYLFDMKLAADEKYFTHISYDSKMSVFSFDRSNSCIKQDCDNIRKINVPKAKFDTKLQILLDRYSVEIFINDGERVFTGVIRTPLEVDGVYIKAVGEVTADIVKHNINVD